MEVKEQIKELIEKYNKVVEEKKLKKYNEEMTKKKFIEPLFEALGWDMKSDDVALEEKVSKGRVDYSFRINGIPKFFLEAKALKIDLDDPKFIKQAINYAWHKGCTWAVLTDFEAVKIFNAEWKTSNPLQTHLKTIPYYEFLDRFEELWLLSKDSFEKGLLDKEAEKWGKRTKKIPIDKQLLSDFTRFRELLSKSINKLNQNQNITEEDLDESVQRILDRLLFIRNCEDRELEEPQLKPILREYESHGKGQLIEHLRNVFVYFDEQYNSKIFAEHLCDNLKIDSDVLIEIISGLYQTKDKSVSYNFAYIEADVLGNIYEQYLGHILKKTAKRAKITSGKAYRKEQGIYYTPTYIVDYIVRNTLGELLKKKKTDVEKIRVLDPACGSGSFLIKTFDVLNEYWKNKDKKYSQTQLDTTLGTPYTKKSKILKDNIFGVDLDKQAVEIAQLNLLVKIAERGHRLPLLQQNIKNGNSLIDDEEIAGDKAFKWGEEFKEITEEGGFDVVIGNPPYISNINLSNKDKSFYSKNYLSASQQYDILILFIEKGINLLKENGILSFIISNKFLVSGYGKKLREYLLTNTKILKLIDVSNLDVFKDASTYPIIIICQKSTKINDNHLIEINSKISSEQEFLAKKFHRIKIKQNMFKNNEDYLFEIHIDNEAKNLITKLESNSLLLGELLDIKKGIETGGDKQFVISKDEVNLLDSTKKKYLVKLLHSRDINRYYPNWSGKQLIYDVKSLKGPRNKELFEREKIVTCRTVKKLSFSYDTEKMYLTDTTQILIPKNKQISLKFVLGIINSKLINYFYSKKFESSHMRGGYFRCFKQYLDKIPINQISKTEQQPLIKFVDKMLSLNKRLNKIGDKKTDERVRIEGEIEKIDKEIDDLVYKLYGLTDKEIKVVEGEMK